MAVRFDTSTDVYQSTHVGGTTYTILCWAYLSVNQGGYSTIFEPSISQSQYIQVGPVADGVTISASTPGGTLTGTAMTVGQWSRVALVSNAGALTLYTGGATGALTAVSGVTNAFTPTSLYIGGSVFTTEWFNGRVAAFKQYNSALTAAQVAAEFDFYFPTLLTGLSRHYPFLTHELVDYSGSGNTLTAGGTNPTTENGPPISWSYFTYTEDSPTGATITANVSLTATATINATSPTLIPVQQGAVSLIVNKTLNANLGAQGQVNLVSNRTITVNGQVTLQQANVGLTANSSLTVGQVRQTHAVLATMSVVTVIEVTGSRSRTPILETRYERPPINHPFRVIVQEILTGDIVEWDLPVSEDFNYTRQLTGPTIMTGEFKPEIISVQELGLDGFAYFFHVEIGEEIRASAIFLPPKYEDSSLRFSAEGVAAAPHYTTWTTTLSSTNIDPFVVVRNIWNHVQAHPRSNYGVTVSNNLSGRRLGADAYTETETNSEGEAVTREIEAEPYELLWWEAPNCGDQIDTLAQQVPFDYKERVKWNAQKTDVLHYIDLAYPRMGAPRPTLLFNEENILEVVPIQEPEDTYASEVIVIGAGEGSDTIRGYASEDFADRVRKSYVVTDKTITTKARADSVAKSELGLRRGRAFEIAEIVIPAVHPNASIGEYDLGDDIYVEVEIPWLLNTYGAWYRIVSINHQPSYDRLRLGLERSDSFRYPTNTQS